MRYSDEVLNAVLDQHKIAAPPRHYSFPESSRPDVWFDATQVRGPWASSAPRARAALCDQIRCI